MSKIIFTKYPISGTICLLPDNFVAHMHKRFDHKKIEKKWQARWQADQLYKTSDDSRKPKAYVLDMFPYPSGDGLHVGHSKGYIATDVYSRFKRMAGYSVLHPMGWDAFGLPAENFAIKNKVHPQVAVEKNVARYKTQLEVLGADYDWSREINTTDPAYYKWTQWIFIQLYKKGLAYESDEPINWCPQCQTGLANEDLEADGTCERCGTLVEKKPMRQWVLKIRDYADRLLEDLNSLKWPEHIKEAQRNWIGRSEGAEIDFSLSVGEKVKVFTTRPDTLFGVTYLVLAPEHALIQKHKDKISNWNEVSAYLEQAIKRKEMDRLDKTKEKTGVKLEGVMAINPASGEEIPVYIADYVLAGYGTGAIMAVPAHDERDFAFARKYGIEIRYVIDQVVENYKAVGAIIINKNGEFLLQTRTDDAPSSAGKIGPFGGMAEEGESALQVLARELKEELNLDILRNGSTPRLIHVHQSKLQPGMTDAVYLITDVDDSDLVVAEGQIFKCESLTEVGIDGFSSTLDDFDVHDLSIPMTLNGVLINSDEFDGMTSEEAKRAIVDKVGGRITKTYKIKDWVFSRQRYWGEPIPMVRTESGGVYPVVISQLPVTLPEVEHYEPAGDGQSPLVTISDWVNVTGYVDEDDYFVVSDVAPAGYELINAKRETNTMPQWAGSSWYYLRYIDPANDEQLVGKEREQKWAPVDVYVGGDHAVRHLIYARFWHKFLYDIGVVSSLEPFQRLEFLGFVLAEDGRKMSKRWGNVINPDDVVDLLGADTLRVYEMFMGPFENVIAWSRDGLAGARRFLERVNGLTDHIGEESRETTALLHKTLKKVTEDIEGFKFNTAISAMMIFVNQAEKTGLSKEGYLVFLRLLAPFAPHLTEELWLEAGQAGSIHTVDWPVFDSHLATDTMVTIGVQINGKVRGQIEIAPDADEATAVAVARADSTLSQRLAEIEVKKIIYVKGRILNLIGS